MIWRALPRLHWAVPVSPIRCFTPTWCGLHCGGFCRWRPQNCSSCKAIRQALLAGRSPRAIPAFASRMWRPDYEATIRATLGTFEGRRVFDLRVWLPRSSDGVLVPGKKGITLDRTQLPELERAVRAAISAIKADRS